MVIPAQINQTCSSDHTTGVQALAERSGVGTGCSPGPTRGCPGEPMGHSGVTVSMPIPVSRVLAAAATFNIDRHGPGAPYLGQEQIKLQTGILSQEYLRIKR